MSHFKTKAFLLLTILIASTCFAQPKIYREVSKEGEVTYTNKKPSKQSKPIKLPEIMKGEYKIDGLKTAETCGAHGGANCALGADEDGSVICFDGFKKASIPFEAQCATAKLRINEISEIDEVGRFKLYLRNSSSIAAKGVVVTFNLPTGEKKPLEGPEELDGFGMEVYKYDGKPGAGLVRKVTKAHVSVSCDNC